MTKEQQNYQPLQSIKAQTDQNDLSVCSTPEEQHKLLKLLEILLDVEKSMKIRSNEANIRNTNHTSQT